MFIDENMLYLKKLYIFILKVHPCHGKVSRLQASGGLFKKRISSIFHFCGVHFGLPGHVTKPDPETIRKYREQRKNLRIILCRIEVDLYLNYLENERAEVLGKKVEHEIVSQLLQPVVVRVQQRRPDLSHVIKIKILAGNCRSHVVMIHNNDGKYSQGWAKFVLIALERYSVELKRLTFNFR